ncbi:hypothetical protein SAMN05216359_105263 [Roseateles sp. YR242]|uniref:hypothetical protein n=1 Tax=Roseateles sp. YR242 TaxID=1855305 RepID=UPI0008AAEFD8|nr:hypothetical protein [Roseateles sp. YR242]SEL11876.1 hypothetical protein SAMN05216359_105263 [Roseateles sp. YR242]
MRAQDLDRFCGLPYCARSMDCADLFVLVQRELFGRAAELAGTRPRPRRQADQAAQLVAHTAALGRRVDAPQDGDAVLMLDSGQSTPGHIGTYFFLAYEPWVLHTSHVIGASRMHRLHELPAYGLRVEGFYRWN